MREIAILSGLLLAVAFFPAEPAKAETLLGCECVKFGAPAVCTATVTDCNFKVGGVCVAPCTYQPPKAAKKHYRRHAAKKKKKM